MTRQQIREYVEVYSQIDISNKSRKRMYVEARTLYYVLMRENTTSSYEQIGQELGFNHCVVLHCINKVWPQIKNDPDIKRAYNSFSITAIDANQLERKEIIEINQRLREEIETLKNKEKRELNKFTEEIQDLTDKQTEIVLERFRAMVKMVRTMEFVEVKTKEMEGALK
jgi:hypothetical protein